MIMLDALFSFLLFLTASALIIAYFCWSMRSSAARKYLDEELQLMLDKLPRRAPEPPPAPSNPNETASP